MFTSSPRSARRGFTLVMMAMSLVAIMGCVAMSVDVGRICIAAEQSQNTADAAAMAAAPLLAEQTTSRYAAVNTVSANNTAAGGFAVTVNSVSDIVFYGPNSTVPGFGPLGSAARAVRVTGRVPLNYTFARVVGLTSTTVTRSALAVRAPAGGSPIAPMWISEGTPFQFNQPQNLLAADGPHYADIPGNFGWLQVPDDVSATWDEIMQGVPISDADRELLSTEVGDSVWGLTGVRVGGWAANLQARISAGTSGIYSGDYFGMDANGSYTFSPTNPRIILIPLVDYLGGSGSNAEFRVVKYGAFWLDKVNKGGNPKSIDGRFIQYSAPGLQLDPMATDTGIFTYRLVG